MPDRRMQRMNEQRDFARSLRARSFAVSRGWPQFYIGLGIFLVGVAITVFSGFRPSFGGGPFAIVVLLVVGLTQMGRALGGVSTMKRLDAEQAPLSQRQPWLFAPSPFAADGSAASPGWLADPMGSGRLRFWDGQNWTVDTRPDEPV